VQLPSPICDLPILISNVPSSFEGSQLPAPALKDIIEWDVRTWSHCLDFWAPVLHGMNPGLTRVLTVGERNGGLSLWFALQGYQVTCSDYERPTQQARALHEKYGVTNRITYADVNIFASPYPDLSFDIVACKSVIGGLKLIMSDRSTRTLNNQSLAIAEIHRVLSPGGFFLGAENLTGTRLHQLARGWSKPGWLGWRHLTMGEIRQLFASFDRVEQQAYGFFGSHFTLFGLDRLTAALDSFFCPFLPAHWQYVSFIRARKHGSSHSDHRRTAAPTH
jgi:SAM-dependent methyltransferase